MGNHHVTPWSFDCGGTPVSACFRIANIWLLLNLEFFIGILLKRLYWKILLISSTFFRWNYPSSRTADSIDAMTLRVQSCFTRPTWRAICNGGISIAEGNSLESEIIYIGSFIISTSYIAKIRPTKSSALIKTILGLWSLAPYTSASLVSKHDIEKSTRSCTRLVGGRICLDRIVIGFP